MDIVKRYTYFDLSKPKIPNIAFKYWEESKNWVEWFSVRAPTTCAYCSDLHGHILSINDPNIIWPPVHEHCHCLILSVPAFKAGTVTDDKYDGVDCYLFIYHHLPDNYVTKKEAKFQGWRKLKGNLWDVLPGAIIGGDIYRNIDGRLPESPGRVWYEADFDYMGGFRNNNRIIYSNDGLVFVTYDHYLTFSEVYWEDNNDGIYNRFDQSPFRLWLARTFERSVFLP